MGELFWRLLLKINTRVVFLFTVLLLCLVLVFISRKNIQRDASLHVGGHSFVAPLTASVDQHRAPALNPVKDIDDPFTSAFLLAWLDLEETRHREREAARAAVVVAPKPKPLPIVPAKKPPSGPRPEPLWVSVKYQGMIERTDGASVALVLDVESGRVYSLKVGEPFMAGKVKTISSGQVLMEGGESGEDQALKAGIVCRVRKDPS